ncbi:MAG: hypothetical protein IJ458_02445 [Clostridia bacterium]|nr:hypothetical protein [Clostridia bacterium]
MDNIDYIFTDKEYDTLNKKYSQALKPCACDCINELSSVINELESNSFQTPLNTQNKVLSNLYQSKKTLELLHKNVTTKNIKFSHNPFNLIYHLNNISTKLNSHTIKSPYQIIYLKSNEFILKSINILCEYFMSKNIKIFKFI